MSYLKIICVFLLLFLQCISVSYASETIKVGVSLGLSGEYAVMAQAQMKGYKLWQQHVNERGGLLNKKVELIIRDDKSDAKTAAEIYENFIVKREVDLLFAPYSTKITSAVLPIAERHRFPVFIAGSAGDSLWEKGYKYAIGVYTPASRFATGFMEILLKAAIKDVAIIHSKDGFSKDLAAHARQAIIRYGLNLKANIVFDSKTADYSSLALEAKNSGAEAVFLCAHFQEAVSLRLALKRLNWQPKAFYASVGGATPEFQKSLGDDANGVFSTSLWESQANFPGNERFYRDYLKTYDSEPAYHAALAYAGGQVLESAVKNAKSIDPQRIRDTSFALDEMTIIGRYGIDKTGKQVRQHTFIIQWQNCKKEIVWPEKIATSKAIIK